MGGLVTRAAYHLHGAKDLHQVYFVGSPHHGAAMAYYALHPEIPYEFLPGIGGTVLNAGFATAVASRRRAPQRVAQARAGGNPIPQITAAMRGALENAAGFLTEAALGDPHFDRVMKLIAQGSTGVFELLPDEDYFSVINPSYPVITANMRMANVLGRFQYQAYVPSTWEEAYIGTQPWCLPKHLEPRIMEAMEFKKAISAPLPPEDGTRCFVTYGAKRKTPTEVVMHDRGRTMEVKFAEDRQGGDGTVPKESGRGQVLWPPGTSVYLDDGADHFMLTETSTLESILRQHLLRGDR